MKEYDVVIKELNELNIDSDSSFKNKSQNSINDNNINNSEYAFSDEHKLLNNLFDSISDGVSVLNKDLEIKKVNNTMKKLYKNKMPVIGKKCFSVYQNRDTICPWCPSTKAIQNKSLQSTIVPYPDEKNPQGWLSLTCFPLIDNSGNVYGIIEQVRDITAHKKMEDRFRMISEVTTDLIYEWDIENDTLTWFGNIDEVLGYEPGEIQKTINGWINLIHPEDLKKLSDSVQRHRTETKPIEETYRVRKKNGSWVYWEDRGKPILDFNGKPIKWIGGCKDVTKQKEIEEELLNKILKLERYKKVTVNRELRIKELKQKLQTYEGAKNE